MVSLQEKRATYDRLAALFPGILFMSSGLAEADAAAGEWLRPQDRRFQYHFALARRMFRGVGLSGSTVLEVGSGRGGNCYYLSHYTDVRRVYGLDESPGAVRACAGIGAVKAEFLCGDTGRLPFPPGHFDVVFAVERGRDYPPADVYFAEVHRVLRPGGTYVQMESRRSGTWDDESGPLAITAVEDISEAVFQALRSPGGVEGIFRNLENDENREWVEFIQWEIAIRRISFSAGVMGARITRMVKP